jgi:hypothetical protein
MRLGEFTTQMKTLAIAFHRHMSGDDDMKSADMSLGDWLEHFMIYLEENAYDDGWGEDMR